MVVRYSKVSVPAHLMERLTAIISARPELGYRSASDAVTECLRRRVDELGSIGAVWYGDAVKPLEPEDEHAHLWVPVCPHCARADARVVQMPGGAEGPANPDRLFAHWTCRGCGARNQLPTARWAKKD